MDSSVLRKFDGNIIDGLVFCRMVYAAAEELRGTEEGLRQIRLRSTDIARKLMGELLPIACYVQTSYRPGRYLSVKWVNGSQSFDAEIHQHGGLIDRGHYPSLAYLEITSAMHENEYRSWSILVDKGFVSSPEGIIARKGQPWRSEPVVFSDEEHVSNFAPIIIERIKDKASINYPEETSLVIQCHLNTLYTPNEWRALVDEVESKLQPLPFKEIILIDGVCSRATPLIFFRKQN